MIVPVIAAIVIGSGAVTALRNMTTTKSSKSAPRSTRPSPIVTFLDRLQRGERPTDGQYQSALVSCLASRRFETARHIDAHFGPSHALASTMLEWSIAKGQPKLTTLLHEAFPGLNYTEYSPLEFDRDPALPEPSSPEWQGLLSALRTESPDFADHDHVGQYHHHIRRVSIFCDPAHLLANPDEQAHVLTADLHALWREFSDVTRFEGTEVVLPGDRTVRVNKSGLLALLKCAGPRGAIQWLTTPSERVQFPNTTAAFEACNSTF